MPLKAAKVVCVINPESKHRHILQLQNNANPPPFHVESEMPTYTTRQTTCRAFRLHNISCRILPNKSHSIANHGRNHSHRVGSLTGLKRLVNLQSRRTRGERKFGQMRWAGWKMRKRCISLVEKRTGWYVPSSSWRIDGI